MGLIKQCKICSRKGLFLKLNGDICIKCSDQLTILIDDNKKLSEIIILNNYRMKDSINKLKEVLIKLSEFQKKGIELKFNPMDEYNTLLRQEPALIALNNIQNEINLINTKGRDSFLIEKSINLIKNEYLPLFKNYYESDPSISNTHPEIIETFIIDQEVKLERKKKRESKILDEKKNYIAFDIETTGLSPETCEITEIAAVKISSGEIIDTFQCLVKPKKKIPKKITNLTGITNEMVSNSDSIEVVLPKFIDFIEKLPLVAHNVEFDYSFISYNYQNIYNKTFRRKKSCTMKLYRKYYKEMYYEKPDSAKLSACVFDLLSQEDNDVYSAGAHRALTDATMVYKIYEKIKNY